MNFAMALDYQDCINCKACEVACKEENGVQLGADKQRIWVGQTEKSIFGTPFVNYYPSQCNHCIDAPCVDVCPTEASYFNDGGLVMVINVFSVKVVWKLVLMMQDMLMISMLQLINVPFVTTPEFLKVKLQQHVKPLVQLRLDYLETWMMKMESLFNFLKKENSLF